ncbi:hypothetical protein MIR68_009420 [Amoeboaphelidium protococcarum]|nr:hypothetical protein MIR68_009420 [Amoeboaphelidium protococcarum]
MPELLPVYGLFLCPVGVEESGNVSVPLKHVHAAVDILDTVSHVQITQKYHNSTSTRAEVVYKFPLAFNSAVNKFQAKIFPADGSEPRTIVGVVKEKDEAAKEYKQAVSQGHRAALLEEAKADIFTITLGNLDVNETIELTIGYVSDVLGDDECDKLRFVLPTTISPRYIPAGQDSGNAFTDATGLQSGSGDNSSNINDAAANYKLSVDVNILMNDTILSVESPSHPVNITKDSSNPRSSKVSLAWKDTFLDKDFVLVVKTENFSDPRVLVEYNEKTGTHAMLITMVPRFKLDELPCEFIFVADRSGSMEGFKIEMVKQALELFLKSLPENSYFNIIGFGSSYQSLFSESRHYSETSLNEAMGHVRTVRADLGGTELRQPLEFALQTCPKISGFNRRIFVLTDGEVGNTDEIKQLVTNQCKSKDTCVYSLGIGNSVSHELVDGIALGGHGNAEYAMENERLEKKILKQLKMSMVPLLKDLKVEWIKKEDLQVVVGNSGEGEKKTGGGQEQKKGGVMSFFSKAINPDTHSRPSSDQELEAAVIQQAPAAIPQLLPGKRFLIFCFVKSPQSLSKSIKLSGTSIEGPIELELPVDQSKVVKLKENQPAVIHALAARKLIQDLENEKSFAHYKHNKSGVVFFNEPVAKPPTLNQLKQEIVHLGVSFQLMSRYTSFVAVDHSQTVLSHGALQKIVVPTRNDLNGGQNRFFSSRSAASGPVMMAFAAAPAQPSPPPPTSFGGAAPMLMSMAMPVAAPPPSAKSMPAGAPQPVQFESARNAKFSAPMKKSSRKKQVAVQDQEEAECESYCPSDAFDDRMYEQDVPMAESSMRFGSGKVQVKEEADPRSVLTQIVRLQVFNGSYPGAVAGNVQNIVGGFDFMSSALFQEVQKLTAQSSVDEDVQKSVTVTAFVIAFFTIKLTSFKDEWELVVKKSEKWLTQTLGDQDKTEKVIESAKNAVSQMPNV